MSVLTALGAACLAPVRLAARRAIFQQPRRPHPAPPPGAHLRMIPSDDGHPVPVLHLAAPPGAPTVVHFHGAGLTLRDMVPYALELRRRGCGVALVEYRGYGEAPGRPDEDTLYRDGVAVVDAIERETGSIACLSGISLGAAVAMELAARGRGRSLLLLTPFTDIRAVFARLLPALPVDRLVDERFDNLAKAPRIAVPTLVVHGERDGLVPTPMGQRLAEAIAGAKLRLVPRAGHFDLFEREPGLYDELAAFVLEEARGPTRAWG